MAIRFGLIGHGFMGHVHEKTTDIAAGRAAAGRYVTSRRNSWRIFRRVSTPTPTQPK